MPTRRATKASQGRDKAYQSRSRQPPSPDRSAVQKNAAESQQGNLNEISNYADTPNKRIEDYMASLAEQMVNLQQEVRKRSRTQQPADEERGEELTSAGECV